MPGVGSVPTNGKRRPLKIHADGAGTEHQERKTLAHLMRSITDKVQKRHSV